MHFENVYDKIGEFGRYQKVLYILLCIPGMFGSMMVIQTLIFHFAVPKHRCSIPGLDNDTYEIQDTAHELMVNLTIPRVSGLYGVEEYSSCDLYSSSNTSDVWSTGVHSYSNTSGVWSTGVHSSPNTSDVWPTGVHSSSNTSDVWSTGVHSSSNTSDVWSVHISNTTLPCTKWVYDRSQYISTMAQSFDLVCDKKPLVSVGKMMHSVGQLLASLYNGPLSDTFGRRPVIIANTFFLVLFSISMTWINSAPLMFLVEVLVFQCSLSQYITSFVFGMEIVAPSKRMWTGISMNLFWSSGNLIIALSAYLWREWRTRQLIITVPAILLAYVFFLPESPRWLLKHGKPEEAKRVLIRIAKGNKKDVDPQIFDSLDTSDKEDTEPFWKLLKSKILLRRMLVICYLWFAISMSFFGLSMNVTNLSGDIYLNFFLFVLLEVFAYILCYFLMDRLGRKKLLCMFLIATGSACILTLVPVLISETPNKWAINALAIIGNTFASVNFAVVYTFTCELSSTTTRSSCMGLGSLCARVGSMIAPFIADITLYVSGRFGQILPMLIFGSIVVIAGLLTLLLPETLNKRLPETIKEAETLGTKAYREDEPENTEEMIPFGDSKKL